MDKDKETNLVYILNCKYCGRMFTTNNKHRGSCYECKIKYPFRPAQEGGIPFVRIDDMIKDKWKKLVSPNKIKKEVK